MFQILIFIFCLFSCSSSLSGVVVISQDTAQITVTNNRPDARWTLLRHNILVHEGIGSVTNMPIPDGSNYKIIPEPLEGFIVRVNPGTFDLIPGQSLRVSIAYERSIGAFSISASFPIGQTLGFTVKSPYATPATYRIQSKTGKIFWQSQPLQPGVYEIIYDLPENFEKMPSEKVLIKEGQKIQILPKFVQKTVLHIKTNIPEAIFLLTKIDGSNSWKGEGKEYLFIDIPPGTYRLSFSTKSSNYYIPPKEMIVSLNDKDVKKVDVVYQIAGQLTIQTNIDRSHVDIQEIGGLKKSYHDTIYSYLKSFTLPGGRYKVTLSSLKEDRGTTAELYVPEPVETFVKPLTDQILNLNFSLNIPGKEKQRKLNVSSDINSAGFNIYKLTQGNREWVGHYSGKNVQVVLPPADHFEIEYDTVPNYVAPENAFITFSPGDEKNIQASYTPLLSFIIIPSGKAIIGDPIREEKINKSPAKIVYLSEFSISIYEVTNAEFAAWLNEASQTGTIAYIKEADRQGQVVNLKDQLLFKTFEADPFSQITAQSQGTEPPFFAPIAGKDSHPVINVTWYGANEYCKDKKCRLPTEAEWEKAAGMVPDKQSLKKYRYGFGQNTIDRTWANYKDTESPIQSFQVRTTPVGFYNGVNTLPLSLHTNKQEKTHLAKSPYGAFDMSGNVWEWVSDWYDEGYYKNMVDKDPKGPSEGTKKVIKGGSYDSLADGVRVSERMGLRPDYSDAYTGFRIAK